MPRSAGLCRKGYAAVTACPRKPVSTERGAVLDARRIRNFDGKLKEIRCVLKLDEEEIVTLKCLQPVSDFVQHLLVFREAVTSIALVVQISEGSSSEPPWNVNRPSEYFGE